MDAAVELAKLAAQPCTTRGLPLTGAAGWNSSLTAKLIEQATALQVSHVVDASVAAHLARAYGDRAPAVLSMAHSNGPRLLAAGWPVLDAEVTFCARTEFCSTAVDFLARRSRLAFLDVAAARQVRLNALSLTTACHLLLSLLSCLHRVSVGSLHRRCRGWCSCLARSCIGHARVAKPSCWMETNI